LSGGGKSGSFKKGSKGGDSVLNRLSSK
jgi:hypothetical protein